MKMTKTILSSAFASSVLVLATAASAQVEAEATAAPAEEPAVAEEAPAEEPEPVEEAPAEEPAEVAEAEETEEPEEAAPAAEAEEVAAEVEVEEESGGASLFVFADAWAGAQTAPVGSQGGNIYALNAPGGGSAENGFGLAWLGADFGYDGGKWAVNGSLRFGDAVATYGTGTLGPITNAYVSWLPTDSLSIDVGTFGTIYGAEVAESWNNLNYTRGQLYFNYQPFWHTGAKVSYDGGSWSLTGLVANKSNNSNLGTGPIEIGLQLGLAPSDDLSIAIGALQTTAPDAVATDFIDTFVDVVVAYTPGKFSLVANGDFNAGYGAGTAMFWGGSLAAGYAFTDQFGLAARGEVIGDDAGRDLMVTGTLTADIKPVAGVDNFVVRADARLEFQEAYFGAGDDIWFGGTLGFVGYADLL